jgi:hypothetical protein
VQIQDVAPLPQANALPRTLGASPLTQSLQTVAERLQTDRAAMGATQLLLNLCATGDSAGSAV